MNDGLFLKKILIVNKLIIKSYFDNTANGAAAMEGEREYSCGSAILSCLALSITYVASLYVWNMPHNR